MKALGFPLFIYLRKNDHLILRFREDQEVTESQLHFYLRNNLENFWCPNEYQIVWEQYLADHPEEYEHPDVPKESTQTAALPAQPDQPQIQEVDEGKQADAAPTDVLKAENPSADVTLSADDALKAPVSGETEAQATPQIDEPGVQDGDAKPDDSEKASDRGAQGKEDLKQETAAQAAPSDEARSEESATAIDVLTAEDVPDAEKQEVLKEVSERLVGDLSKVDSKEEVDAEEAIKKIREFSEDIVKVAAESHGEAWMGRLFEEVRQVKDLETPHSGSVSAFAVLLATGIGYTDQEVLAELSLGGMIHDVGISRIDPALMLKSAKDYTPEDRDAFRTHVKHGMELLKEQGVELGLSVRQIVEQHHERFDGSGYPNQLKGFELSELAQIVGIADCLDDLISGRFDGAKRSPQEALEFLEKLQKPGGMGLQFFNPELFESVSQLIRRARERAGTAAPSGSGDQKAS